MSFNKAQFIKKFALQNIICSTKVSSSLSFNTTAINFFFFWNHDPRGQGQARMGRGEFVQKNIYSEQFSFQKCFTRKA